MTRLRQLPDGSFGREYARNMDTYVSLFFNYGTKYSVKSMWTVVHLHLHIVSLSLKVFPL